MAANRVIIMGAAGRDFHNFNTCFRDNPDYEVVAFTATQIPDIDGRVYPPELAGPRYPEGIAIFPESDLSDLIRRLGAQQVVFSYSDVSHEYVMHRASQVMAAGADFRLLGADSTMLASEKPIVSVCAVRTGCGKSQTTRRVCDVLQELTKTAVVVRHPMPYGDLKEQACQRFATYDDLDRHNCTIEEREEYEPHINRGIVVFAGVDYEQILREAERETADVIVWDGGNNDLPFYRPDLQIVVTDPLRSGHELTYHPGETNLRLADVVVINKIDSAAPEDVYKIREGISHINPTCPIIEAASPVFVEDPAAIRGKTVLVVEDGPTLTHGGMAFGAGVVAAQRFGASEIIDPRPYATGSILDTFRKYPTTGSVLPAMGYSAAQRSELGETIRNTPCDLVLIATPIDLRRVVEIDKPCQRVSYELQEIGKPDLMDVLSARL